MEIDKKKLIHVKRRVLDEIGHVYRYEDKYIRVVKKSKTRYVQKLFNCGLLQELEEKGYLWPIKISNYTYDGKMVLESDAIFPVQHSNSWTFEMHKAVGKLLLKVNEVCISYGYELLDAHQGNVMWKACFPKFIDVGSIIKKRNDGNWTARREFLQAIFHPLSIWANGYPNIAKGLICSPGYRNDDEIRNIYEELCQCNDQEINDYEHSYPHNEVEILADINHLKQKITELSYKDDRFWTNYQDSLWEKKISKRFKQEVEFINDHPEIQTMLELGSNQGYFTYQVAKNTNVRSIIASDYDHDAIEKMYSRFKDDEVVNDKVFPMILDFLADWNQLKNYASDIVVANALTHHLIFTSHIPLDCIVDELKLLTNKYLIVEFMPRGMASASRIPQWYNLDWFINGLSEKFNIIKVETIEFGRIQIYAECK